ncbi:hypothetical protein FGIG_03212 [Fasciola gigantica]|uniref:Uncharacterized protein n=1 Tax=Fasciola gigantica TaxID=46835 RepID=A0A504YTG0_FASGI|nr:hypothetical protein FGIG_03212 [Fasciola gigantica]
MYGPLFGRALVLHSAHLSPKLGLVVSKRHVSGALARLTAKFFRLRYLILGSGIGGGYAVSKKYDDFKDSLPDTSFIFDYLPEKESFESAIGNAKDSASRINERRKEYFSQLKTKFSGIFRTSERTNDPSDITVSGTVHAHTEVMQEKPKKQVSTLVSTHACSRKLHDTSPLKSYKRLCSKKSWNIIRGLKA